MTARCLELGLNLNIVKFPGMGAVLRIAPPMTVTGDEIDRALEIMSVALTGATCGQRQRSGGDGLTRSQDPELHHRMRML